jgi:hypothetical protein
MNPDNRADKANWRRATSPRPIREKRYKAKADQVPRWQILWNGFLSLVGWGLAFWLMYETINIFLGGGYGR